MDPDANLAELDKIVALPQKPNFTGMTYDEAVEAATAYNDAVTKYNEWVTQYNAQVGSYKTELEGKLDAIKDTNKNLIDKNITEASSTVSGIETTIQINNANDSSIFEYIYNTELTDKNREDILARRKTLEAMDITTAQGAASKLETLTDDVNKKADALSDALKELQAAQTDEAYSAAAEKYNTAIGECETAFNAYNAFVAAVNGGSGDTSGSTAQPSTTVELEDLAIDNADTDHWYTEDKTTTYGGWSTAEYFIQIKGTVPVEEGTTGYGNDDYVSVGTGAVIDATLYPNGTGTDGKTNATINENSVDIRDGHNRVDVSGSNNIITSNAYNNEVINLDHITIVDSDGNETLLAGMPLEDQLDAYYANVNNVLISGTAGEKNWWNSNQYNIPSDAEVIESMHTQKVLDDATYQAYQDSVEAGTPSLAVLWYVVKDKYTGTSEHVHVDGAVYFTDTGIIYDGNKLTAITTEFTPLQETIKTNIEKLDELKKIDSHTGVELATLNGVTDISAKNDLHTGVELATLNGVTDISAKNDLYAGVELATLNGVTDISAKDDLYTGVELATLNGVTDISAKIDLYQGVTIEVLKGIGNIEAVSTKPAAPIKTLTHLTTMDLDGDNPNVKPMKDPTALQELRELKSIDARYAKLLTTDGLNPLEYLDLLERIPTGGEENPIPEPDDELVLILTDVPTEEELLDEETPLGGAETEIGDEETPLADAPDDSLAEIDDEDVALSGAPKTGDSAFFLLMSTLSGFGLAVLTFLDRKGRHARFGAKH